MTHHSATHGGSDTKLYRVWINMRQRCNNPNSQYYADYGGRGVTVCPEWNNYAAFAEWASAGYQDGLTLDREGNGLLYSPDTCRWVGRQAQQRNRRGVKGSSSQYVGVSFLKRDQKYMAGIKIDGKAKSIGYFDNELDAAKARDQFIVDNKLTDFTLNNVL